MVKLVFLMFLLLGSIAEKEDKAQSEVGGKRLVVKVA